MNDVCHRSLTMIRISILREVVRTAEAADSEVKKVRRKGVRINAKIDADLEIKPKRTKVKTKVASVKASTTLKRKRTTELEEEDDEAPVKKYQGAEGALEDNPTETKPNPKKPETYTEDCSARSQPKRQKMSSLER